MTAVAGYDVVALRAAEFPWTDGAVYLNNASIGPIPERTRRALDDFNARRGSPHRLPDRELQGMLQAAREAAARLIGAGADEIALAVNTSHGVNLAASALPLARGDIVLVPDREFPANVYPWLLLERRGVTVELVPPTAAGWPDEERLLERLRDPRVRALAVSYVQFSSGYRADLDTLGAACRANSAYLVVDAIQGIVAAPFDVRRTPVDVLACGGQKWLLSPWGSGFVYVRRELVPRIEPVVAGWMAFAGTDDFTRLTDYDATFRADARRFEMITLPFQDCYGMTVSLGLLEELGIGAIAAHTRALHEPVWRWADARGVAVTSPRDAVHGSAIVCVAPSDPRAAHRALKAAGVTCSVREGAIRLSPHCYNTMAEMEQVVAVLETVR